jgi:hypothetical protein
MGGMVPEHRGARNGLGVFVVDMFAFISQSALTRLMWLPGIEFINGRVGEYLC